MRHPDTVHQIEARPAGFRHLLPLEITDDELLMALDEGRNGSQCWLWMRHKTNA